MKLISNFIGGTEENLSLKTLKTENSTSEVSMKDYIWRVNEEVIEQKLDV